ncbi:hypothetical protein, partial [Mesorhizobium sp. M7A.F.Ca.MR.362.00.0.0]|uniref:hypothetical protein n=1 Tax=Mesorhizobium sp. M7A.F.Ca.MR.362.00.0.0 TaxID=2496779 RepID=UPI0013E3B4D3
MGNRRCVALGLSLDIQRERLLHLRELPALLSQFTGESELAALTRAIGGEPALGILKTLAIS